MSSENISIELDQKFIENFFGLADMPPPSEVNLEELNNAVAKIKEKFSNMALSSTSAQASPAAGNNTALRDNPYTSGGDTSGSRPKSVIIVDDLGIITYQLEILFKKMGFETIVSHEINDAIDKFKKQDFGYAVIDLFIPTEREGFILLDEIKKLSLLCKLNTKIIVMTASAKEEYKENCINRGADFYIEKSPGWQKELMQSCMD